MPRLRPKNSNNQKDTINRPRNVLQTNRNATFDVQNRNLSHVAEEHNNSVEQIVGIGSILDDDNQPCSSTSLADGHASNTAALYDELDTFRLRWRRELQGVKTDQTAETITEKVKELKIVETKSSTGKTATIDSGLSDKENIKVKKPIEEPYDEAKKLFLKAVQLEQDELHHESIRYYKQAIHLYPDIEKAIFREQCEESARVAALQPKKSEPQTKKNQVEQNDEDPCDKISLYERIVSSMQEDSKNERCLLCRPATRVKPGILHISDLPYELMLQILRYIIGQDLDLASLDSIGLVSRGFYLMSRDRSLWRSICYSTWGDNLLKTDTINEPLDKIDWMHMYLTRPRVNYDGVYISRTRYIRQGDVGFQDLTYRPFHVIRYYRYVRFFTDKRVLILTTNEEPDKIVPIFRNAQYGKQFSPELSILEGKFEFLEPNQVNIVAEKNCRNATQNASISQRRQAQFHWSRQTPINQKFTMRFELKTLESKPYRNNVLKWAEYTINTRLETGQEVTAFDLSPDIFPNLLFSRVRRLNLRLANPLLSH